MLRSDYPAKYLNLIDDEMWAFIERTNSYFPKSDKPLTTDQRRQYYDEMCRAFSKVYPAGVSSNDGSIESPDCTIPVRRYHKENGSEGAQVIYYHGGGFVLGGLESHDDVCADICVRTGLPVTAIDYRLAPENRHPADFNDALAAFRHIAEETDAPIVLVGDSAGACLCAAVCQAADNLRLRIAGQVLIYPLAGLEPSGGSYDENAFAPGLTKADILYFADARTGGDKTLEKLTTCAPINAADFVGTPPTVSVAAQCDPLLDDAYQYHDALKAAGTPSHLVVEDGLVHGYLRARDSVPKARESFNRIVEAIEALGQGRWPY